MEWLQEKEKAWKIAGDQVRILMYSHCLESQAPSSKLWPEGRIGPVTCLCKRSALETWPGSFVPVLSMLPLHGTEAGWSSCNRRCALQSLKYLLAGPFQKKFASCWSLGSSTRHHGHLLRRCWLHCYRVRGEAAE